MFYKKSRVFDEVLKTSYTVFFGERKKAGI
jgi:hypothetical protein